MQKPKIKLYFVLFLEFWVVFVVSFFVVNPVVAGMSTENTKMKRNWWNINFIKRFGQ